MLLQNPTLRVYSSSPFRPLKTILKQRLRGLEESCGGVVAGVTGGRWLISIIGAISAISVISVIWFLPITPIIPIALITPIPFIPLGPLFLPLTLTLSLAPSSYPTYPNSLPLVQLLPHLFSHLSRLAEFSPRHRTCEQ